MNEILALPLFLIETDRARWAYLSLDYLRETILGVANVTMSKEALALLVKVLGENVC